MNLFEDIQSSNNLAIKSDISIVLILDKVLGEPSSPFTNFVLLTEIVLFLKSTSSGVSANTSPILSPVCNCKIAILLTVLFFIFFKITGISSFSKYLTFCNSNAFSSLVNLKSSFTLKFDTQYFFINWKKLFNTMQVNLIALGEQSFLISINILSYLILVTSSNLSLSSTTFILVSQAK